jgi:uncharacterized protein
VQTIVVKVKPNARASELRHSDELGWIADLKSPPVDGKANAELVALVARRFGCRKADVTIAGGAASRTKRVAIDVDARNR